MTIRKAAVRLTAVVLIALALTGCGSNNFRDLEGVPSRDPDKVELFNNADLHPNLVMVCIHGVAFITTTREYNALTRVPELDRQCPGSVAR